MRRTISFHRISSRIAVSLITMLLLTGCGSLTEPLPTTSPTVVFTIAPTLTATPSPTAEAVRLTLEATKDIPYAYVNEDTTLLDVYAPSEPGPWPVIVTAHGRQQGRSFMVYLARSIAYKGAVVYNIDVNYVDYSDPIVNPLIGMKRIACAIRFARATAEDYGGDPNRITLVGSSLGAYSGAVVALAGDDFEGDCVENDASALPDALVAFEGPYDHPAEVHCLDLTSLKNEDPELWEAINPYSHIGRNPDLQVRLLHGEYEDRWGSSRACFDIPPQASIDFHQALEEAGYDATLTLVDSASHTDLGNRSSEVFQIAIQQTLEVAHSPSP